MLGGVFKKVLLVLLVVVVIQNWGKVERLFNPSQVASLDIRASARVTLYSTEWCGYCKQIRRFLDQKDIPYRAFDIEKDAKAYIIAEKCIGCGECLAVCRFDAVKYDWDAESGYMQRSMAEHAYGIVKDKAGKVMYFNVMIDMTKDCDCFSVEQTKCIPDIGILASTDPVAIDKATLDLTAQFHGRTLAEMSYAHHNALIQVEHAAKIGMGSLDYELITVE